MTATLEVLGSQGSATDLHYDAEDGCIWLDPDGSDKNGLVVGVGSTRERAIRDALQELSDRIADLWLALKRPHESARPCGCDPGAQYLCDEHAREGRS